SPPGDDKSFRTPARDEMCAVRIGRAKDFLKKLVKLKRPGWVWDHLARKWNALRDAADLIPGMTVLLPEAAGGYSARFGWTGDPKSKFDGEHVEPDTAAVQAAETATQEEANNQAAPILLADHTDAV